MTRAQLLTAILEFLGDRDLLTPGDIRTALEAEIDGAGPAALGALRDRLIVDNGWGYYPRDPLARRIHHRLADRFLRDDSLLTGAEHLRSLRTRRAVIVANHLSYADANVVEVLLQRSGATDLADRLTAVAGPKVFTSRQRRFSSLCFGTVKVPQSADVSTGEARLGTREVARAARESIRTAHERLERGDVLLVFAEGTRSRTGAMTPMLAGAARYFESPGTWILPLGLTGTEKLFPIDAPGVRLARVELRIGAPIGADALLAAADGNRRIATDTIALSIAELLPAASRGVYADPADFPDAVRARLASTQAQR